MNNFTLKIKISERLNKLSSNDYDNIECWQIAEAFNKGQVEWTRRVLENAEQSVRRLDDLNVLLKPAPLTVYKKDGYYESRELPEDFLQFNKVSIQASKGSCTNRDFVVYLGQEVNSDVLRRDVHTKPSFEWAETFNTLIEDKVRIYTNNEFLITSAKLYYYRFPRPVQFNNCMDPETGKTFRADQTCEFKDDIAEILVDEACAILSADIENFNQMQKALQASERNT